MASSSAVSLREKLSQTGAVNMSSVDFVDVYVEVDVICIKGIFNFVVKKLSAKTLWMKT